MSGRTLEEVLRDHLFTLYPGQIVCDCEWTAEDDDTRAGDGRMIAAHVAHVAAEVRAWLAEALAGDGLREAVARALEDASNEALLGAPVKADGSVSVEVDFRADADTALTAVREHLGVREEGRQERATGAQAGEQGSGGVVGRSGCGSCLTCDPPKRSATRLPMMRMYVCAACGNKRCPAASDCRKWKCSGSNEPGQVPVPREDYGGDA